MSVLRLVVIDREPEPVESEAPWAPAWCDRCERCVRPYDACVACGDEGQESA